MVLLTVSLTNLSCVATIIINLTPIWNKMDQQSLESAKRRCAIHFADSPCLKKFTKTEPNTYRAICTGESK
jgi:hypothetical protein